MAEKGTKKSYDDYKEEALGYIHNVEEVKNSQRNQSKFFCCQLQGESSNHKVVCFSPQKHSTFVNAAKLQSPVKLSQIKYSPGKRNVEILINHKSNLDVMVSPLSFKRKLTLPESTQAAPKYLKLINAIDDSKTDLDGSYIIKGKVIKLEEEKNVILYKNNKRKRDIIVHDGTNYITVSLYEDLIDKVQLAKCYSFSNVGIRKYMDLKSITTKTSTEIVELVEEIILPTDFKLQDDVFKKGNIASVCIDNFVLCTSCNTKFENIEQILLDKTQTIVKCQNSLCRMATRKKALTYSIKAILAIDFQGKLDKYTLPNAVALEFLEAIDKKMLLKDSSALEMFFLDDENIFEFKTDNLKIVTKIQLGQANV